MKNPTYAELKVLVFLKKRIVSDTFCWILFFLLTTGYCSIKKDIKFTWSNVLPELFHDSLFYTVIMMIAVYFNFNILKKYLLDIGRNKISSFIFYLISIILLAVVVAGLMEWIPRDVVGFKEDLLINALVIFGVQLIATGLLYLRELQKVTREYHRSELQKVKMKRSLQKTEQQLEELKLSANHIKIGTKYNFKIIPYEEILYFEGDNIYPNIYTSQRSQPYLQSNYKLKQLDEKLPRTLFKRIHKSYIIGKLHIYGRTTAKHRAIKGRNFFLVKGTDIMIPIGDSYKDDIDKDELLGFHDAI